MYSIFLAKDVQQIQRDGIGIMNTRLSARTGLCRRDMLLGSAAALMGAYGLAPRYGLAADIPMEYDGSKFQMAAPEPNPKRGGVLRYGILNRPPHFDVHQSGTVGNIGTQGCMFDNLIRHDPRDSGKTIIPDLAHSLEIAKDGKSYTFFLRKGVQFHDGESELAPGITLHHVGGHTKGLQVVRVKTRRGHVVLASDAAHLYANMEREDPFPIFHDRNDYLAAFKTIASEVAASGVTLNTVLPGRIGTDRLYQLLGGAPPEAIAGDVPAGRLGTPEEVAETNKANP